MNTFFVILLEILTLEEFFKVVFNTNILQKSPLTTFKSEFYELWKYKRFEK
jgi:hypothetical protein